MNEKCAKMLPVLKYYLKIQKKKRYKSEDTYRNLFLQEKTPRKPKVVEVRSSDEESSDLTMISNEILKQLNFTRKEED